MTDALARGGVGEGEKVPKRGRLGKWEGDGEREVEWIGIADRESGRG